MQDQVEMRCNVELSSYISIKFSHFTTWHDCCIVDKYFYILRTCMDQIALEIKHVQLLYKYIMNKH